MRHNVGHELLDVPFPEMIYNMAYAIAQSQIALDLGTIRIMKTMGNKELAPVCLPKIKVGGVDDIVDDDENFVTSMIGAGFQPTFYQFAETIIEVSMTITMREETEYERTREGNIVTTTKKKGFLGLFGKTTTTSTPINAKYTNKYGYNVEGKSLLRTRLVPCPPNTFIQRLLDMKAQAMQSAFEVELAKVQLEIERLQAAAAKEVEALPPAETP